ncbi:MAG: phosphoenolpyruvate synthase [Leptolyngbya sp.]|nr:phosphoenolpyruvate synthase [Candidatus Melainabacteria bacterium]
MKYIVTRLSEHRSETVGNKASNLARLKSNGFHVPDWFCILPEAFENKTDDVQIRKEIAIGCLKTFSNAEPLAVRSSAFDEDGNSTSFAGQLDTFLNVGADDLLISAQKVFNSANSDRLTQYRKSMGLSETSGRAAVIVQRMVEAKFAGIAFSSDPLTGENRVVISATNGLADTLVSGEIDGSLFYVSQANEITVQTASAAETTNVAATADKNCPSTLALEDYLIEIADMVRDVEKVFCGPQDIEWAHDGEKLYVLQARPITTSFAVSTETAGAGTQLNALKIWDNSNIAESYQGVTTPLTFSFARKAYEHVYIHFCTIMGVSQKTITANRQMFPSMLGFIRGRIYYNLINWYRLLALLPGFQINRSFMEKMMGVKEELPAELIESVKAENQNSKLASSISLVSSSAMMVFRFFNINRDVIKFRNHFDKTFNEVPADLSALSTEQLVKLYRNLEEKLLYRWDAPIVNDFFAMIFSGLMGGLCQKWLTMGAFAQNEFLVSTGGIISAEPAARIKKLAQVAAKDVELLHCLTEGSQSEMTACIERNSEFANLLKSYLDKFGDRCFNELKLESPTLLDNPLPLLRNIGSIANQMSQVKPAPKCTNSILELQESQKSQIIVETTGAQAQVNALPFAKRILLNFVIKNATERIRCRENLRFERTRLFGLVRRLFIELGSRFERDQIINERNDIFFLEVEEIFSFVECTGTTRNLKKLIEGRKQENSEYTSELAPPNRIETTELVATLDPKKLADAYNQATLPLEVSGTAVSTLSGLGCCPGIVRGRVRVVRDPSSAEPLNDEILIAERTDPGWIVLFTQARGIIVEYGSLLSHTAIVSRELAIPSIVSATGVMSWLKDGDLIEFDGAKGLITRLAESNAESQKTSTESGSNIGEFSEHDPAANVLRLIDSTGLLQEAS